MKKDIDEVAYRELELYSENEGALNPLKESIIKNIVRKMRAGKYNPKLAPKLWLYYVEAGAKKYLKDFGAPGEPVSGVFSKQLRVALATNLAKYYGERIANDEWSTAYGSIHTDKPRRKNPSSMRHKSRKMLLRGV